MQQQQAVHSSRAGLTLALQGRRIIKDTGRLLLAFCIGSVATVLGTLAAMKLLPLRSLGPDNWRVSLRPCTPGAADCCEPGPSC